MGFPWRTWAINYYFNSTLDLGLQSPLFFPPLLSILYALPVFLFGYDLELFKALQLIILGAGLIIFADLMKTWAYNRIEIACSLLLFGLSFELHRSINSIGSDLPFVFFLVLGLWATDRFVKSTDPRERLWRAAVCGLTLFLAIDLRTVAIALIPTVIFSDWFVRRKICVEWAVILGAAAVLWGAQRLALGPSNSYNFILNFEFLTPIENLRQFYEALAKPWENSGFSSAADIGLLMVVALAAVAAVEGLIRGKIESAFFFFYTALLLVLPNFDAGARYLVPHLLFLGAFACRGIALTARLVRARAPNLWAVQLGTAVLAGTLFTLASSPLPAGPLAFGVHTAATQQAFSFLRTSTPPGTLIAAGKSRSFHLFTDRQTISLPQAGGIAELFAWAKRERVSYIVIKHSPPFARYDFSDCPDSSLCERTPAMGEFAMIFENRDFAVFEVRDAATRSQLQSDTLQRNTDDSLPSSPGRCRL